MQFVNAVRLRPDSDCGRRKACKLATPALPRSKLPSRNGPMCNTIWKDIKFNQLELLHVLNSLVIIAQRSPPVSDEVTRVGSIAPVHHHGQQPVKISREHPAEGKRRAELNILVGRRRVRETRRVQRHGAAPSGSESMRNRISVGWISKTYGVEQLEPSDG